jgi:hypothetical protein
MIAQCSAKAALAAPLVLAKRNHSYVFLPHVLCHTWYGSGGVLGSLTGLGVGWTLLGSIYLF